MNRPRARRGRNLNEILAERRARRLDRLRTVVLGAAAFTLLWWLTDSWLARRTDPNFVRNRVVVVPLDNRTGQRDLDTLGLVAADWITRVLSLYAPGREVVPTTTTLAYTRSAQLGRLDLLARARRLGRGTRAPLVVWGAFYQTGDTLRFNVEITDLQSRLMVGSIPQISAPRADAMRGVDRLRSGVVGALLHTESVNRPINRRVPDLLAYQSFVNGLSHFMRGQSVRAAEHFAYASARDSSFVAPRVWRLEAELRARRFAHADSVSRALRGVRATRAETARALRGFTRLRADYLNSYWWTHTLAAQNPADDLVSYELALAALALGRLREARRIFSEQQALRGVLHGHPDFYLHYAAAFHMLRNHRAELGVVRKGLRVRHRALPLRLANCRARAALGKAEEASAAMNAIAAADTDTTGALTVWEALHDCAAELDAHGLTFLAERARGLARTRIAPRAILRDSVFEPGHVDLEQARRLAERGQLAAALNALDNSFGHDLPFYEPGRMMLHAEPSFRRLRNTRGFLRLIHPRG